MPFANLASGVSVHYQQSGKGDPLILITGLNGNGAFWNRQVEALSATRQVITYDQRGCGQTLSDGGSVSLEVLLSDLLDLMDSLSVKKADIAGHSLGGAVAQRLAIEHPERVQKLVLSATWARADARFLRLNELRSTYLEKAGSLAYLRSNPLFLYPGWWLRQHPELLKIEEKDIERLLPDVGSLKSRMKALAQHDTLNHLQSIQSSTLVIAARDDVVTPAYLVEELAEHIPGSEFHVLPTGGHFYPQTMQEDFNSLLESFLSDSSVDDDESATGQTRAL